MYEIFSNIYTEALTNLVKNANNVYFYDYDSDDDVIKDACEELHAETIAFVRIPFATKAMAKSFEETFLERAHSEIVKCHLMAYEDRVYLSTKRK